MRHDSHAKGVRVRMLAVTVCPPVGRVRRRLPAAVPYPDDVGKGDLVSARGVLAGLACALGVEVTIRREQADGEVLAVVHLGADFARGDLIE